MNRRPTFTDSVRAAPVRLRDGREGHLLYFPSRPRLKDQASVDVNGQLVLVDIEDVEVTG